MPLTETPVCPTVLHGVGSLSLQRARKPNSVECESISGGLWLEGIGDGDSISTKYSFKDNWPLDVVYNLPNTQYQPPRQPHQAGSVL